MKLIPFEWLFWVSSGLVFYVYAGYPLFLWLFASPREFRGEVDPEVLPTVSFLISAYNERAVIGRKLENAIALDYPRHRLEIIVISDCSDDGTDEIVKQFEAQGVRLVRQTERLGKSSGLNLGVAQARGEILVFSDANAIYQKDALRLLVRHFSDPKAGYIVGNARYVEKAGQEPSAESEGLYWKLETWLKRKESAFGSVVGGDGAIYGIRAELFTPLLPTDINDFLNPLQIICKGYKGVYEPQAICLEEAGDSFTKEFRRKVRIVGRSLNAVFRAPAVLLPWMQPRHWLALVSHKLLRWFIPLFLLVSLAAAGISWRSPFYLAMALLQLMFYLFAASGWILESRRTAPRIFYLPYYFCLVNLASLLGIVKFLNGSLSPTWQTVRHDTAVAQPAVRRTTRS